MLAIILVSVHVLAAQAADTNCPRLPCPFTGFCKSTTPTYFDHNGVKCRGCDQCIIEDSDHATLSAGLNLAHFCPMVMCMNPGKCDVPYTYSTIKFNGINCTGCATCPTGNHPDGSIILKKKQVSLGSIHTINMCPMVMCMAPGPCSEPLKTSVMHMGNKECPGCAYCPTTTKLSQ